MLLSLAAVLSVAACELFSPTGWQTHRWLIWNLFLAWVPLAFSLLAFRLPLWFAALPGLFWLLFLPNAPYIVTDLIHVGRLDSNTPAVLDFFLIALTALTGLSLGMVSLLIMEIKAEEFISLAKGKWFSRIIIVLAAVGVYLGRIERWNSWDILSQPADLISSFLARLTDPLSHPLMFSGIILFALASLLCYEIYYHFLIKFLRQRI
jgi:uncharacterized membrane protein